jgi:hypothetical protein
MAKPEEKKIIEQMPPKRPLGDLQQEGLTPSNTKPMPIPAKPQPKPQSDSKPAGNK